MIKKILFIVVLSVSVAALAATTAQSFTFGGFSINIKPTGSYELHAEALLQGIGFCLDGECAEVCVGIYTDAVQCNCMNPGGNCGGLGSPFYPDVPIGGSDVIGTGDIYGKGKAAADICWHSDYITQEISEEAPADYCSQNLNWQGICGDCYITQLDATFNGCAPDKNNVYWLVQQATLEDCTIDLASLPGAEMLEYTCKAPKLVKYKIGQKLCEQYCPTGPDNFIYNQNGCIIGETIP